MLGKVHHFILCNGVTIKMRKSPIVTGIISIRQQQVMQTSFMGRIIAGGPNSPRKVRLLTGTC
jgi:hypothetical protein